MELCDMEPELEPVPDPNQPGISRPPEEGTQAEFIFHEIDLGDFGSEPLPKAPIYDQGLQRGIRDVKRQLCRLVNTFRFSEVVDDRRSHLKELKKETEKLANFQFPKSRTVGFIGTSGEGNIWRCLVGESTISNQKTGKSSVINSLLNQPNIARAVSLCFRLCLLIFKLLYPECKWHSMHFCGHRVSLCG
jgi:hypothetical protein